MLIFQLLPIKPSSLCVVSSGDPTIVKIHAKHVSFYKLLLQGMSLGAALSRMSSKKVAPVGLKHQECKCRRGSEEAPIHYLLEQDPVQEALNLKPKSLKCTLKNGSKTQV